MKVMLVNGSSHIHGTTMKALEEMVRIFEEEGIETEIIQLGSKTALPTVFSAMPAGKAVNVCSKTMASMNL